MQCQGPDCTNEVQQKEGGHRARKYCSDACRVAAHRVAAREAEAERVNDDVRRAVAEKEAETARERQEISNRYPMLSDASIDLLLYAKQHYGLHAISTIGSALVSENEAAGEGQAKYKSLLADYMQAGKKMGHLERQIRKYERLELTNTRESMLQELMVLGGRLKYASLTDLGIGGGIDQWRDYARGISDRDLSAAIAHAYYQADTLAMAAIEANDHHRGIQMRQRINELERTVSLQRGRIDELEHGAGENSEEAHALTQEQVTALHYHARERALLLEQQARQIEELEQSVRARIDEIHRLEDSHGITMYRMNLLLAEAQSAAQRGQTEGEPASLLRVNTGTEQELERLRTLAAKQEQALAVRSETVIKRGATIRALEKAIEEQKNQLAKVTGELGLVISAREADIQELVRAPHIDSAVENAALKQSLAITKEGWSKTNKELDQLKKKLASKEPSAAIKQAEQRIRELYQLSVHRAEEEKAVAQQEIERLKSLVVQRGQETLYAKIEELEQSLERMHAIKSYQECHPRASTIDLQILFTRQQERFAWQVAQASERITIQQQQLTELTQQREQANNQEKPVEWMSEPSFIVLQAWQSCDQLTEQQLEWMKWQAIKDASAHYTTALKEEDTIQAIYAYFRFANAPDQAEQYIPASLKKATQPLSREQSTTSFIVT